MEGDIPTPGPQTSEPGPSTRADEKAESGELRFFLIWFNCIVGNNKNDVTCVLPSFGRKASPRMCVSLYFDTRVIDPRVPQGRAWESLLHRKLVVNVSNQITTVYLISSMRFNYCVFLAFSSVLDRFQRLLVVAFVIQTLYDFWSVLQH